MPNWARYSSRRVGACVAVTSVSEEVDPFLAGFYAAAETAYDLLFWPVLDELLWEDATWSPDPLVA